MSLVCNGKAEVCELMNVSTSELELRALMISGLDGDAAAHRTLLETLSSRLRGYFKGQLNRIGRGPVEAEDLVQEALMAIHTRRHTYDSAQPFTPCVYAIARYKFVDYLRREKASMRDLPIEDTKEIATSDTSGQVESSLDLERLMEGLAPKARRAVQAVKLDGLSVGEAAAQCGMSESNVKVTVHRALKAMTRLIRENRS